mgnify:CR=1 FL=1
MKSNSLRQILVLFLIIPLSKVNFAQSNSSKPINAPGATTSWYTQIQKDLSAREYLLHQEESAFNQFRAFNRKNNIIGHLKAGSLYLEPKPDSGQTDIPWQAELKTTAILFDGETYLRPSMSAKGIQDKNTVEFHHGNFTEQYINNEQGLRQNFIIHEGPQSSEIRVELTLNGLKADKRSDTEIALYDQTPKGGIQTHTLYKDLKSWDAHGIPLESHFEVINHRIALVVNTKNAVYPITIDPISTTAASQLESNQAYAQFGRSVASAGDVNGDGYSDVIVGAYYYDNGQTDEGAAFIYHGSSSGISTTAASQLESNQVSARFGRSVASAGDVNGDGYSDVIVGAHLYDNGQSNEGAAFIYHGSSSGISTTAASQLEENQANAQFGRSVASAGDVNGDGYSDVIVGADLYDNGQTDEGAAFIYHGSSSGLSTTAATQLESNQANAQFGISVSSAGDVNGDGYSDVIVGAHYYDNGAAFVYLGNNGGTNNHGVLKDYDDNLSSLYTSSSFADANRGVGLTAKSFLGRQKAKLVYETKAGGDSYSGTLTGSQNSYSDLGTSGTELKTTYAKNNFLRVRVKYDPATSITGQVYGPWRYMTTYKLSNVPLPVELIHFDAQAAANHTADLHWATASEINNSHFEIERSYDGIRWEWVGNVTGNGTTSQLIDYNYADETIAKSQNTAYYRLKQIDYDGAFEYSDVRVVRLDGNAEVFEIAAYPNPFNQEVTIRVNANEPYTIQVTDINGVVVLSVDHTESRTHRLDASEYTAGVYIIEVTSTQGTQHLKVIKQ